MAGEGKNKAASSLLDLQPTAVLELFKFYPDRINKPSLFVGFHGGAIYSDPIKWQGLQYVPIAIESEGFDMLGDGKLPRPKVRLGNKNNIITNLLQNFKDFKNAKTVRKKVQVKFLDDDNFDGGNPFGVADSKAELLDEEWIMGRKTQESKIFVEFELNSPLDIENFSVNSRGVQGRFCYWQYRGEGCRYQGLPVEMENGRPFLDSSGSGVVPQYNAPLDPDGNQSQSDFLADESLGWNATKGYSKGDIVIVESPTILLPPYGGGNPNAAGSPLKTVYVSVADFNTGNHPEKNPSFWQKDGCTKRLTACRKRFNTADQLLFRSGGENSESFPCVKLSGAQLGGAPEFSGLFHTTDPEVTGALDPRGDWTIVGWANINENSPLGAGVFSTSQADNGVWPAGRFLNINLSSSPAYNVQAQYIGHTLHPTDTNETAWRTQALGAPQLAREENEEWRQYIIRHRTGTAPFINGEGDDATTMIEFFVDGVKQFLPIDAEVLQNNLGNFASWNQRYEGWQSDGTPYAALPETFMLGAVEYFPTADVDPFNWPEGTKHVTTMNGNLGMWGLWKRALKEEEIRFLRKRIVSPWEITNSFTHVPRLYSECIGLMSTLTGGTGDGLPEGTEPLLYGKDSLVAWWDGTTGSPAINSGMLDIHTGEFHLTGSGAFSGVTKDYSSSTFVGLDNYTPSNPRFGGFPGTDGFSHGRTI